MLLGTVASDLLKMFCFTQYFLFSFEVFTLLQTLHFIHSINQPTLDL